MPEPVIPIAPETEISVILQAQQWNVVIGLLSEVAAPHRITDPLIATIGRQAQAAAARVGQNGETIKPGPRPNGPAEAGLRAE